MNGGLAIRYNCDRFARAAARAALRGAGLDGTLVVPAYSRLGSESVVDAWVSIRQARREMLPMKLIIQIPCLNESATLAVALDTLPREVNGFDRVEWLVVDDGSTDGTAELARQLGVDHVVRHPVNRGLATAFMTGIDAALRHGADVIVNTDADNQYEAGDIPALLQPILENRADMVIGARPIAETAHFSWVKKKLQQLGSWAVRIASKTDVADAPSGFRAMTREAAMRLNVFNAYTYTLETIIQAGLSNLSVVSVPVRTNADLRPSRLVHSIPDYVRRSLITIFRVFVIYRPMVLFFSAGAILAIAGFAVGVRFLVYFFNGDGGHAQSLIFSALCLILGGLSFMMGLVADLISVNRKLLERVGTRLARLEGFAGVREATVGEAPGPDVRCGERQRHQGSEFP